MDEGTILADYRFDAQCRPVPNRRRIALLLTTTALLGLSAAPVLAQTWTGATDGDWHTASNWDSNTVPNAATDVVISDTSANVPEIFVFNAEASSITVGGTTPATLNIVGTTELRTYNPSFLGFGPGEEGVVNLDTFAKWTSDNNVFIGLDGIGRLNLIGANDVDHRESAYLGLGSTGQGFVSVDNNAGWVVGNVLGVGIAGQGDVQVTNFSIVRSNEAYIGGEAGGVGVVTLQDDSIWQNTALLAVGFEGHGTLNILGGAEVTSGTAIIGGAEGAFGQARLAGVGLGNSLPTWTVNGPMAIGVEGEGLLEIDDNGFVDVGGDAFLGVGQTGVGTVSVENQGIWAITGTLRAGIEGTAVINVESGGTLVNQGGVAGLVDGSAANILVTGNGSGWSNNGNLQLGVAGDAALTVSDGAGLNVTGTATLGEMDGGSGMVGVDDAVWINNGDIIVGQSGYGLLSIFNGGNVFAVGSDLHAAAQEGGAAAISIDGQNSLLEVDGNMTVGDAGSAAVLISGAGTLTTAQAGTGSEIGMGGGIGWVGMEGAGSSWTNHGTLHMGGGQGHGNLRVADGAQFTNNGIAYIGQEADSSGEVLVNGGTWTNASSIYVGDAGDGVLVIEDGGLVTNTNATIAAQAGSTGAVTANGSGVVWSSSGGLGIGGFGDAELTVGENAIVFAQGPVIAAAFAGSSADVIVDGTLIGLGGVTFNAGSHLSGTGTVSAGAAGTTTMNGTIAPGNSIGTLFIIGNYVQNAGSTYEVEIDAAGNSDLIDISGTATLNGGEVVVIPFPDFALATPYTILTAAGGVTGQFDPITNSFSYFLSPELSYDPNNVYLTIQQSATFESAAMTPNQIATAQGADSLPTSNPVWTAIAMLPDAPTAQHAFDQLSGEVHGSVQSALIDDSRFVRDAALNRIRDAFAGVGAAQTPVLAYGENGPELAAPDTDSLALWAHGFGSWGHWDGDGNAAQLDRSIGGLFVGGDLPLADWRVGALAGYSRSNLDVNARASSANVESWHLGLYGGTQWGDVAFRTGAAYSWHDISTARTAAFPGFADSLTGDYSAGTGQIFGELAYGMDFGAYRFEPFANLAYVHQSRSGFTEQGGPAALTASSASTDTAFTTLGLRGATEIDLDGTTLIAHATLGWRHAFGDVTPTSTHAFAGGAPFTIAGTPIARDAAVIEAGLDFRFTPQASLGLSYSGQLAGNAQSHGFSAKLGVSF